MSIEFKKYPSTGSLTKDPVKLVNVLIVGLTGSGKSSIIKSICSSEHSELIEARMAVKSVTKNLKMYEGNQIVDPENKKDRYIVNLIDTVGLGDSDITVPAILKEIVQAMPKDLAKIHKVVFCFKMDRLRAKMSEELNMLYNFFRLVGAKPENFVVCLTFCDFLSDETIKNFWDDVKAHSDLAMMKDIQTVTFTSFPNLQECDNHIGLHEYLEEKMRLSGLRIFENVIAKHAEPFYPQDNMLRMPAMEFDKLCTLLREINSRRHWWWNVLKKTDQEDIIEQINKLRSPQTLTGAAFKQ